MKVTPKKNDFVALWENASRFSRYTGQLSTIPNRSLVMSLNAGLPLTMMMKELLTTYMIL
jgi:hypothetical protein